jgi:hypothetical protein
MMWETRNAYRLLITSKTEKDNTKLDPREVCRNNVKNWQK